MTGCGRTRACLSGRARASLGLLLGAGLVAFPYMYGSGYPLEEEAIAGNYSIGFLLALMVGRALYTSFTIGIGGSGGVFAPTLFIGAMAGAAFGDALSPVTNSPVGVFAVVVWARPSRVRPARR